VNGHDSHRHDIRAALLGGVLALSAIFMTAAFALLAALLGVALLTGNQILVAWGMAALVLIVFFAFAFRRLFRVKVEASREKGAVDIDIGRRE
jgi:hypothetical protein